MGVRTGKALAGILLLTLVVLLAIPSGLHAAKSSGHPLSPSFTPRTGSHPVAAAGTGSGWPSSGHPVPLPPKSGPRASQHAVATGVNPEDYYSAEPAPMGIADFGVDASLNAYSYTTSEFVGSTQLRSLVVSGSGSPSSGVTIQLNVVLFFQSGSNGFYYWIQDVPFIDTSTNQIAIENNIWNLSGSSALYSSTLSGTNGSIYTYGSSNYYAAGASSQPGSGVTLHYPTTVNVRVYAQNLLGKPTVQFDYNDGYHWQRYDTVTFGFPTSATQVAFLVDGNTFNPSSLYNDAELTLGGPGGGSSTTDSSSDLFMSIQFWNGHNLQEIPNAWNFGSNTAESISGLTESQSSNYLNGSLYAHVTHGSGSLGNLYARNYSAILNATPSSMLPAGDLRVNSTTGVAYTGDDVNLTLAPGSYSLDVYVSGVLKQNGSVVLRPGEYLAYNFIPIKYWGVTFRSSGLPTGTPWSIWFNNTVHIANTTTQSFRVPSGSYPFTVGPVSGWSPSPSSGTVQATTGPQSVNILWTQVVYQVSFASTGLPAGTVWGIHFAGTPISGAGTTLSINEPNGTFNWSADAVSGWMPSSTHGTLLVMDGPQTVSLVWSQVLYSVRFNETGLPQGTAWSVLLGGTARYSSGASVGASLPNGSYLYSIPGAASYLPTPNFGTVDVNGSAVWLAIGFRPMPATLSGSVHPGSLSLFVNGTLVTVGPDGSYSIQLPPGSYNVSAKLTGYYPFSQIVTASPGAAILLNITLVPEPQGSTGNANLTGGLPLVEILAGVGILLVGLGVALAVVRRRSRRPPPTLPEP